MKLKVFSKRLLASLAASFTLLSLPGFAKSDVYEKSYALGVHAASQCHADRGYIGQYAVNGLTRDVLNQNGYGEMYAWLNTSNGKKAVSVAKGYLNSKCTLSDENAIKAISKAYKYF